MKKTLATLLFVLSYFFANAQFTAGTAGNTILSNIGDNVGMGTSSPGLKAHIVGALGFPANTGTTQTGVLRLQGTGSNGVLDFSVNGLSGASLQATALNNLSSVIPLSLNPNGGNVGIGTASPQARLHVLGAAEGLRLTGAGNSGATSMSTLTFYDSDNATRRGFIGDGSASNLDMYMLADAGGGLNFGSGGVASRMFINPAGSVGIGTSSPIGAFDVKLATNQHIQFVANTNLAFSGAPGILSINDANNGYTPMGFYASNFLFGGGNVGIGTTAPSTALDVNGVINANNDLVSNNGTVRAFLATSNSFTTGVVGTQTNHPLAFYINSLPVARFTTDGGLAIGTTDAGGYKLAVNGTIHSKEVLVDLVGWSDYVFNKNYKLRPLNDVRSYVEKNHHLPNVPSAAEVEKNGVKVGEMNKLLMKKVEELTLYLIEQNKRIEKLEEQLKRKQ